MIGPFLRLRPARAAASVARLRREVATWARTAGIDEPTVDDLVLVLSELATNAVEHGSGPRMRVVVGRLGHLVDLRVLDDGPASASAPSRRGGHGLAIVRALAEELAVEHGEDGTCAHVRLRIRPDGAPPASAATLPPVPGP